MNISEKDKKTIAIFSIFIIIVLYYIFFLKASIVKIKDMNNKNIELNKKVAGIEKVINDFKANKEKTDKILNDYISISEKLPPNQDEKFTIIDTYKLSELLGNKLSDFPVSKKEIGSLNTNGQKLDKVFSYSVKANWSLDYETTKKLLENSKNFSTLYTINNLSLTPDKSGKLSASFDLKFFGYEDAAANVRPWNTYSIDIGKNNIFQLSEGASSQNNNTDSSNISSNIPSSNISNNNEIDYIKNNKDFLVMLSTANSPTSAISLEKSGSGNNIFGANSNIENVNILVSGANGKYTFSMGTEAALYPKNGSFEEFKPLTDKIIILISSQARKYENDTNKAIINIHNKTDKQVYVYITNDDTTNPRANVVKDGNNIYVYSK